MDVSSVRMTFASGWFRLDDGGSYVGEVERDGTAHGFGVTSGPNGRGEFAGSWKSGFEQSGTYTASSGLVRYEGQWSDGKRNGLGLERRGDWVYQGEWANGFRGRYGVRQSCLSSANFQGTWSNGLQDGYGVEQWADGGFYQGQWLRGLRHGYGVRQSATYEEALKSRQLLRSRSVGSQPAARGNSETILALRKHDRKIEGAGGFVLTDDVTSGGSNLRLGLFSDRSGRPTEFPGNIFQRLRRIGRRRSVGGTIHEAEEEKASHFQTSPLRERPNKPAPAPGVDAVAVQTENDDLSICDQGRVLENGLVEKYFGEWKQDKRCGYGVCQRSDGLRYEGEWMDNKKSGYGRTTLQDGSRLEGKYKKNVLVSSVSRSGKTPRRLPGVLEKVENSVKEAQLAAENAKQKAEIACTRATTAKERADASLAEAKEATRNEERARFKMSEKSEHDAQPGNDLKMHRMDENEFLAEYDAATNAREMADMTKEQSKMFTSRLRLPFNKRPKGSERSSNQSVAKEDIPKAVSFKRLSLPWRKTKTAETHGSATEHSDVTIPEQPGRRDDQFHHQQHSETIEEKKYEADTTAHLQGLSIRESMMVARGYSMETRRIAPQPVVCQLHVPQVQLRGKRKGDAIKRELLEAVEPKDAMHPRRNSLPSMVKEKIYVPMPTHVVAYPTSTPSVATPSKPMPSTRLSHTETYLIEKGARKRLSYLYEDIEKVNRSPKANKRTKPPSFKSPGAMGQLIMSTMVTGFALSQSTPMRDWTSDVSRGFQKMYALESPTLRRKRKTGSSSDVSTIKAADILSREAVYVMSQRRREELIQQRAKEEANRKHSEIVISLTAFQDWRILLLWSLLFATVFAGIFFYRSGRPT